jgi:hypothetical protein
VTSPAPPATGTTDGPESFSVTFRMTEAEQVRASRRLVHRRPGAWFVYFGIPTLALVFDWRMKRGWDPDVLTWFFAVITALGAAAVYLQPALNVRRTRRLLPDPDGPYTVGLMESGLAMTTPNSTGSMPWSMIKKIVADDAFVFLHLTPSFAITVPATVLTGPQLDAFWWVVGRWAPHLVRDSRRA